MQPADLYDLESVTAVDVHPAGELTAFTVGWPDRESNENRSRVWLHDPATGDVRQLTDGHRDARPRFSPDGTRLAILTGEPKSKPQPAVVDIASGSVAIVEGFDADGASAVEWVDDDRLAITGARRPADQVGVDSDELGERFRVMRSVDYRFNGRGWTHDRPVQISIASLSAGSVTMLTDGETDHAGIAVSPDGSTLLTTASIGDDGDLTGENAVIALSLDGSTTTVLTPPGGRWMTLGWVDVDGVSTPAAVGGTDAGSVTLSHPHLLDPTGVEAPVRVGNADVSAASLVGDGGRLLDTGGAMLLAGVRRGRVTVDRYDIASGAVETVAAGDGVIGSFAAAPDGRIVASLSTPTRPADLWSFSDGVGEPIVSLNEELLSQLDLAELETVQIPSTDGVEVEAFITRPPASAPGGDGAGPGLVYIHGGPMFAYGLGFFDEFQLAAAAGYTVIGGNPRGSDGYGEEWAATLSGRLGTIDQDDVTAITDHLAALPEVDPDRIGIGGGSYGGFMTSWMIGHTDRYRAALVERAVTNWESFAGTSDIGAWFGPMLLRASVESDVEALRRMSPLSYATNVTTPTLILHAEEDWRCPIEQAEQLFSAYRRNGVDVTFVRVPGENHELTRGGSPRHRVDRFELVHEFYATHV